MPRPRAGSRCRGLPSRVHLHRDRLRTALERGERLRERPSFTEQLGRGGVGEVLALARDRELQEHRRDRRDQDRSERTDEAERIVVVVAAEEERELQEVRDRSDRRADHRRDRHDEHVAVLDVRELMREHAADLLARQMLEQALGDGHGGLLRATARRKRVRLLRGDEVQPRERQPRPLGQLPNVRVELGRFVLGDGSRAAHACSASRSGEPEHREVEDERDEQEEDEALSAPDEGAKADEQRR